MRLTSTPFRTLAITIPILALLIGCAADDTAPATGGDTQDNDVADTQEGDSDGADSATPVEGIPGLQPIVDLESDDLLDAPFPTDLRRGEDGHLDLSGYPNPGEVALLDTYVASAEADLDGFGIATPAYFRFAGPIDETSLPSPENSVLPGSTVMLANIDSESPEFGSLVPTEVTWVGERGFMYIPDNTLIVQTLFGTPLREATTYAVIVFRTVTDPAGEPIGQPKVIGQGLAGQGPLGDLFVPLKAWLDRGRIKPQDVAAATVFTTGSPTQPMRLIADWIDQRMPAPKLLDVKQSDDKVAGFTLWEGHYESPNLQSGVVPYTSEGGQVLFEGRDPIVQQTESLRFAVTIPDGTMPADGWPMVLYGHGTGGDWKSFVGEKISGNLAKRGFAVMGIDQPLHGPRAPKGTDPDTASFNVFNPEAFRWNFRQSATDVLVQARFAIESLRFDGPGGAKVVVDPAKLSFLGHSHGGLSGAIMAPFSHRMRTIVLSGAGGGIAYTVLLRKTPVDFKGLLELTLQISDPTELQIGHPSLMLLESLVDATDPLAYGPHFRAPEGGRPPLDLLLTSGVNDEQTPAITALNLAAAARMPILIPAPLDSPAHTILGIDDVATPVHGNMSNDAGTGTMALAQFANADHFAIFDLPKALTMYVNFLTSGLESEPPILK